jgi:hypothetical protein
MSEMGLDVRQFYQEKRKVCWGSGTLPTFIHSFNDNDSQAATGTGRNILCVYGGQPWLCYSTNVCNLRTLMTRLHECSVDAADDQVKNKI